ncbi:hypothetical protein [Blastococcus brunescens]|uniref:Uncharacterized protein n=1 Tax=Blastococcus brunescens TaxID=1564165 RepID=A0ABZ1AXR6_9ACTN|nr:hypothetical protein [Blastococcus sp. BMG 8361]WRL63360.1 hypothetical protein U6N30_27025 [Blastococcus sp. BMG 8361]
MLDVSQILLRSMTPVGVGAQGAESGPDVGTSPGADPVGEGSAATEHS